MARLRIVSLWLLFLGVLAGFLMLLPPGLEAETTLVDVGEVRSGETVTHTFRARKTGLLNLRVLNIESSCTCLNSVVTDAQDHVDVRLVMTMPPHSRRVAGEVVLTTNGFGRNKQLFRIEGNCRAPIEIRPVAIDFGFFRSRRDEPLTRTAVVTYDPAACGDLGLSVEDPSGVGGVSATLGGEPGDSRRELTVRVDRDVPVGPLTAGLVFSFGKGTIEPMRVRCLGVAQGRVSANPPEAFFGRAPSDRPSTLTVRLEPPTPFRVIEVRGDIDRRVGAKVEAVDGVDALRVTLAPAGPDATSGSQVAVIQLESDDPGKTRIQVPVIYQDR